jgi:hypothetical protein
VARTAPSPSSSGATSHNSRPLCRNVDESIAELRQIADGGNDILAEAAGITAGSWYASPATHVGYEADRAGMLIAAGDGRGLPMDYDELQRWTRVGYERCTRSRKGER